MNAEITQTIADIAAINPSIDLRGLRDDAVVSFIPMSDVTDSGRWVGKQERHLDEVRVGYTPVADGDILFAKITPCMENGKGAHAGGMSNGVGFGSTEFHVLRAKGQNNPRFLFHWLQAPSLRLRAIAYMGGSAGQQRVQSDFFSHFRIPKIEPAEQCRIAVVLDAVDEAITKTEAVIAKLKQVRAGLLHDLLTRGLDEHGQLRDPIAHPEQFQDSLLGRVPREWEIRSLNEIVASAVDGPFGSNLKTEHYVNEPGVRVVRLQNIESGRFDESDEAFVSEDYALSLQRHQVISGDLLVASMGDENHPLARACLYPVHLPPGIVKADCFRLRMKTTMAMNGFVMLFLNSPSTRRELNVLGQGVTRDRVNLTTLLTLRVLRPPVEEQRHIVKMIEALDLRIQTEEEFHSKLAFVKSGLMTDLLTGRVRVPESIPAMENQS